MFATRTDLRATRDRIPRRVRPFNVCICRHSSTIPLPCGKTLPHQLFSYKDHCVPCDDDVTTPKETIWPMQPHTAAKHLILRKYLDAWFPILAKYNQRIVYLDGFSGPGRYSGGEPGSPIIALEAAITHRANLAGEIVFFFIEEQVDRAAHLQIELATLKCPAHCKV